MNLRELIRAFIKENNLTIPQFAEKIGYTPAYVYDLLKGARRFNEETEEKICNCLGVIKTYEKESA